MHKFSLALLSTWALSGVAMAADGEFSGLLTSFPALSKALAFVLALQIALRGIAEALTKISTYTDTKTDDKIAGYLSEAVWVLGAFLGKFGYGTPSEVTKDKVQTAVSAATKGD